VIDIISRKAMRRSRFSALSICTSVCIALGGCAEPPTAASPPVAAPPSLDWQTVAPLPTPPLTSEFQWVKGQAPVYLGPATGRMCYLTFVGGKFDGPDEWVGVYMFLGYWYLSGGSRFSGYDAVDARARCVAASSYTAEKRASVVPQDVPYAGISLGSGACALTRLSGKMASAFDYALIYATASGWTLYVNSASDDYLTAGARCLTSPSSTLRTRGQWLYPDGFVSVTTNTSDYCVMTEIRGPFRAIADWVWLRKTSTGWSLIGADQPGLGEAAACYH
jgi:hypothetical protein